MYITKIGYVAVALQILKCQQVYHICISKMLFINSKTYEDDIVFTFLQYQTWHFYIDIVLH